MPEKTSKLKDYVIIYRSIEHYEILGYVRAKSLEEAKLKAQKTLTKEAKHYTVREAEIAEIVNAERIYFDIQ